MALRRSLTQLRTKCRQNLDEPTWPLDSVDGAINAAKDRVWEEVRKAGYEFFVTTRSSTDGTLTILGDTYAASSFAIAQGVRDYVLPPDFVELRQIECITSGQEHVAFGERGLSDPDFRNVMARTTPVQPGAFLYSILGERSMRIAPLSDTALDLRITYVAVPPDMVNPTDLLEMPFPLHRAVEEYATADCLMSDRAPESAAYEARGNSTIARFLATSDRASTDPEFVRGMFEC